MLNFDVNIPMLYSFYEVIFRILLKNADIFLILAVLLMVFHFSQYWSFNFPIFFFSYFASIIGKVGNCNTWWDSNYKSSAVYVERIRSNHAKFGLYLVSGF